KRLQQNIHALQAAEFADENEVHRVVRQHRLVELVAIKAVEHDAPWATRLPDQLDIAFCCEGAFEHQAIGQGREHSLGHELETPSRPRQRVMQASAMRRVDRLHLRLAFELACRDPRVDAALCAVTMKNVDLKFAGKGPHLAGGLQVTETEI